MLAQFKKGLLAPNDGDFLAALSDLHGAIGGGHPNAKGKLANAVSIASGQALSFDLAVAGFKAMALLYSLTGAATTDLATGCQPYLDDDATPFVRGLPNAVVQGPTIAAGVITQISTYQDVFGVEKVKVGVTNNNAGPQTLTIVYFLQK